VATGSCTLLVNWLHIGSLLPPPSSLLLSPPPSVAQPALSLPQSRAGVHRRGVKDGLSRLSRSGRSVGLSPGGSRVSSQRGAPPPRSMSRQQPAAAAAAAAGSLFHYHRDGLQCVLQTKSPGGDALLLLLFLLFLCPPAPFFLLTARPFWFPCVSPHETAHLALERWVVTPRLSSFLQDAGRVYSPWGSSVTGTMIWRTGEKWHTHGSRSLPPPSPLPSRRRHLIGRPPGAWWPITTSYKWVHNFSSFVNVCC